MGVILEHLSHLIESFLRLGAECCLVEVVEDVFHHLWLVHSCKNEINAILGILLQRVALKFLLPIEVALGTCHHHIFHAALQIELERAVVLAHSLLVRAIVPDDANHGVGHRLLITVEHIARDGDFQVGLHEAVDVVVATGIVTV